LAAVHRFGKYLHVTEERLEPVHRWFDRSGSWALFFGYYIPGVRHFTALVAGTSKVSVRHFLAYAWSGGLLWISTFMLLGYWLGADARKIVDSILEYPLYFLIALALAAAAYFLYKRRR
jgi:membrane protein DedA with SNARE-associated domain